MDKLALAYALGMFSLAGPTLGLANDIDFSPEAQFEYRVFKNDPIHQNQLSHFQGASVLTGTVRWSSDDRDTRVLVEPYFRIDTADQNRSSIDFREASVSHRINRDWDVLIGVSRVFWGVTESENVVDVINQPDTLAGIATDEKLGQPLLRITRRSTLGTFEAYYLPYFREQAHADEKGRNRGALIVDGDGVIYERSGEERAGDWALRYTNRFGDLDLGLHGFYGTNRAPRIQLSSSGTELIPFYPELTQAGIDAQWTRGSWLWKGEVIAGNMLSTDFVAAVAGFEYTLFDIRRSGIDLGLIAEYLYDDRDSVELPTTLFNDDIFLGARLVLNDVQDTTLLAGVIVDSENDGVLASAEFERRLANDLFFEAEVRTFSANDDAIIREFEDDDVVQLRLTTYF